MDRRLSDYQKKQTVMNVRRTIRANREERRHITNLSKKAFEQKMETAFDKCESKNQSITAEADKKNKDRDKEVFTRAIHQKRIREGQATFNNFYT